MTRLTYHYDEVEGFYVVTDHEGYAVATFLRLSQVEEFVLDQADFERRFPSRPGGGL